MRWDELESPIGAKITSGHVTGGSLTGNIVPEVTTVIKAKRLTTAVTKKSIFGLGLNS